MPDQPPPLPPRPEAKVQTVDPKTILFSVPTISNDFPPTAPNAQPSQASDFVMHEDDWSQVEFFPKGQLVEVQRLLKEYKQFELANRARVGWKNTYVRKITRQPVLGGGSALEGLSSTLAAPVGAAPVIASGGFSSGRVQNGFTIPLGGNVTLYGYQTPAGIEVLGASIGRNPDDQKLVQAFAKLNRQGGLILVDWVQQLLLISVEAGGQIQVWHP